MLCESMKHFDVLDPSLDVRGAYVLEASAGTGKTFAIEHLVARLLNDGICTIDQILVVTFTKAAARELKARIRETLAAKADESRSLKEALVFFDRAQIFTLHGFCHRALAEFAFEAQGTHDFEDKDVAHLVKMAIGDTLRTRFCPPYYHPYQIRRLSGKYQHNSETLIQKLAERLQSSKRSSVLSYFDVLERFKKHMYSYSACAKERLEKDYANYSAAYKKISGASCQAQFCKLVEYVESAISAEQLLEVFLREKELLWECIHPENIKKKGMPPARDVLHYPGMYEECQKELSPLIAQARDARQIFERLAEDCRGNLDALLEKKEAYLPDALLNATQKALGLPNFLEAMQNRYRAVFVDEFQDTDPVQWDIIRKIFLEAPNRMAAIYLIGDPKQSIYGFRSADLQTYVNAVEHIGRDQQYSLSINYRSDPALIEALNAFFLEGNWLQTKGIGYAAVLANPKRENREFADGKGALHFFAANDEEEFFSFIAEELISLKGKENIAFSDTAILVRNRYQGMRMISYLQQAGIPASIKQTVSFVESPAYFWMRDVLQAAAYPEDESAIKTVFASPLVGMNHFELQECADAVYQFRALVREKNIRVLLQKFSQSSFKQGGGKVLENLISYDENRVAYENWIQAVLLVLQECAHASVFSCLSYWRVLNEDLKLELPLAQEEVSIMTIHASKGLEFSVVFALGLAESSKEMESSQEEEDMRVLYVAMTRARHRLYVPLAWNEETAVLRKFFSKMGLENSENLENFIHNRSHLSISVSTCVAKKIQYEKIIPFFDNKEVSMSYRSAKVHCG